MATPYVAFTEQNYTLKETIRKIDAGSKIWQITDNTNPSDIKTYLFYQMSAGTVLAPNPPADWNAFKVEYIHDVEMKFDFSSPTNYIITNQGAVFIEIN